MRLIKIFHKAGSSRLALVLIVLLILLSVAGVLLPQEGIFSSEDISRWQASHPAVSAIARALGLFRVFHSYLFLILILSMAINTFTCTLLWIGKVGGLFAFKGLRGVRHSGFFTLHLSLIGLFAGAFLSAATRMDGYILLTEGQSFIEEREYYKRFFEGSLRTYTHKGFVLHLKKSEVTYEEGKYHVQTNATVEFLKKNEEKLITGVIKVNYPYIFEGISFTLDEIGYSPRLNIRDAEKGALLADAFIALRTFRTGKVSREYRDFLPLPFFEKRVFVTLYPNHKKTGGNVLKTGENPQNPIILVEIEDEEGEVVPVGYIRPGEDVSLGKYILGFTDLRRWNSFKVVDDPGYPVVLASLWIGVAGLILRYLPELMGWRKTGSTDRVQSDAEYQVIK